MQEMDLPIWVSRLLRLERRPLLLLLSRYAGVERNS